MPNAGRITKATLTDIYDLRIKNQWIQGYGEPEHEYQQIYRQESIQTEDTRFSYISGFGQWAQLTGATLTFDSLYQGFVKVVALAKSLVINGESLNANRRMVTLNKQAKAVQLQRLTPVTA